MSAGESWVAAFAVPHDHPSLPGHFPQAPIVPGVLLLELILEQIRTRGPWSLGSIPAAKFLKPVLPGEDLQVRIELSAMDAVTTRARFSVTRAGDCVLEGAFRLALDALVPS